MTPLVSVVVATYDDQAGLDRVLGALERQDLGASSFEVVVADDGSPRPPVLGSRPYEVRRVTHEDKGFRAAAVRNLGAAGTRGRLMCFLDGDTVPTPGYLSALLAAADELGPRGLLVGRRRHADLSGWDADEVVEWVGGRPGAREPRLLDDPAWLADAYRWSDDLRQADDESYRHVIAAVLNVTRELWDAVGGFDERFVAYGGEDWELAHRCWLAGADLRHVPEAVAWHDGPDLAGREVDHRRVLTEQALVLADLLPSAALRPEGLAFERPVTVVEVDDRGWAPETTLLVVASVLRGGPDVGVWLADDRRPAHPALRQDARVRRGPVPEPVGVRASWRVRIDRPVELTVPLPVLLAAGPGRGGGVDVQRTRDLARGRGSAAPLDHLTEPVPDDVDLGGLLRRRLEQKA